MSDLRQEEEKVREDEAPGSGPFWGASTLSPFPTHYPLLLGTRLNWSRDPEVP